VSGLVDWRASHLFPFRGSSTLVQSTDPTLTPAYMYPATETTTQYSQSTPHYDSQDARLNPQSVNTSRPQLLLQKTTSRRPSPTPTRTSTRRNLSLATTPASSRRTASLSKRSAKSRKKTASLKPSTRSEKRILVTNSNRELTSWSPP
jgi:hypothetical protein